jgi:transcriptional regulator with GAF, ATPase, and Fis domain
MLGQGMSGSANWFAVRSHLRAENITPVTLEEAESLHILQTLRQTGGVVGGPNGAAGRLGLRRTTLISKMRQLRFNCGQSSALRVPRVASVPSSQDTILGPLR